VAAVGVVGLGIGLLLAVVGEMAPLALLTIVVWAVFLARRVGWALAFTGAVIGLLVGQTLLLGLTPHLPLSIWATTVVVWSLLSLIALAGSVRVGVRLPPRTELVKTGIAAAIPLVLMLAYILRYLGAQSAPISWAMRGDTVQKVIESSAVLRANGFEPTFWFGDVLKDTLIVTESAKYDSGEAYGSQLASIAAHTDHLVAMLWLGVCFIAGVVAGSAVRGMVRAAVAILLAEGFILSTFVSGLAILYGFVNFAPALAVLLLAWMAWRQRAESILASLLILELASFAAWYAWAPLTPLTGVGFLALVRELVRSHRVTRKAVLPFLVIALPNGAFVLGLTQPMAAHGGGLKVLAMDGGIVAMSPISTVIVAAAIVAATLVTRRGRRHLLAICVLLAVAALVVLVLVAIRVKYDQPSWGYYPIKFAWLVEAAAVVVVIPWMFPDRAARMRLLAPLCAVVCIGVMLVFETRVLGTFDRVKDFARQPTTQSARDLLESMFTAEHLAGGPSENDQDVQSVASILDKAPHNAAYRLNSHPTSYLGTPQEDYVNFWVLQVAAIDPADPFRYLPGITNYFAPPSVSELCIRLNYWGPGSVVWTSDAAVAGELAQQCPDAGATVRMLG